VFRRANERIQKDVASLEKMAQADPDNPYIPDKDMLLHFCCECSDENCHERIILRLSEYQEIHHNRSRFILLTNHETVALENVTAKRLKYSVVEKFETPPEVATVLNTTSIKNV